MLLLLAAASVAVQGPQPLTEHIVLASMFKTGYAMVVRQMEVPSAGSFRLDTIPQASLGTLWFTTSEGMKLTSVKNTVIQTARDSQASSFDDLLRLNIGKTVSLTTVNLGVLTGKILGVNGDTVMLSPGGGSVTMISRSEIRLISLGSDAVFSSKVNVSSRGLEFQTTGAGTITMLSLERGMTWTPGYAVTLKEGKKLEVVGKATAVNDLEDLKGVEARFITGWPNVPFAQFLDPLIDSGAILPVRDRGGYGGGMQNQAPAAKALEADFAGAMPVSELGGIQAEDLFFYRQPNVTLKQGERAYYIVFSMEAPYEDLYTWDISDFVDNAQYRPQGDETQDIWHTISFKNTSKQPFSTGAATVFKDSAIIGQDTMHYASPGGKAELQITKAMDVSADQLEEELSRERGALKNTYNSITHDLVTLKGTLTLVNRKSEAVTVRIRKNLTGEVLSTSPEAKVTKTARGLRDVNSRALLEWTQTVPPGKTLTLTYQYKVYIRV